jgi:hypothetical protein
MDRLIGAACVGIILTIVVVLSTFGVKWHDQIISLEMPNWSTINLVSNPCKTAVIAAVVPAPEVTETHPPAQIVTTVPERYAARGGQTWDNITLKTTATGIGWVKLGTQCRIPAGGIVQKMEQWPSPQGDLDTYWRIQYVSQKNAIIEDKPPMFYCAIGSSQSISDTLLETYYTPAP